VINDHYVKIYNLLRMVFTYEDKSKVRVVFVSPSDSSPFILFVDNRGQRNTFFVERERFASYFKDVTSINKSYEIKEND